MAVASRLAKAGRQVEVLDDRLHVGGGLTALAPSDSKAWEPIVTAFEAARTRGGIRVRTSTTAGALFGDDLLVVGPEGAEVLTAGCLVLATGAHDGVLPFEGNDLPGVMSARAGGWMLAHGVMVGRRVVVVVADGGGPFGESYARAVEERGAQGEVTVLHGEVIRATGSSGVTGCVVRAAGQERKLKADAILVDAPRAPSYELAEQAGAPLLHTPRGYVPQAANGRVRKGLWLVGEAAGQDLLPQKCLEQAEAIAAER
jgi:sarcosine oxidase subunit alpha